jgi:hypothetical protein
MEALAWAKIAAQYSYYLRFEIAVLAAFWLLIARSGRHGAWEPLFGGMFDLQGVRAAGVASGLVVLAASLITTTELVLAYGPLRFGIPMLPVTASWVASAVWTGAVSVPVWMALRRMARYASLPAWLAGVAGGVAVIGAALWLREQRALLRILGLFLQGLFGGSPLGYFEMSDEGRADHPLGGHIVAFWIGALNILLYVAAGFYTGHRIKRSRQISASGAPLLPVPALGWVVALLSVLTWTLSGVAFFVDGGHHSVTLFLAFTAVVLAWVLWRPQRWLGFNVPEPHTYRAYVLPEVRPPAAPGRALQRAARQKAIVVCASGGGIHAAAWAAQVLETLMREARGFREHVVLTSSVSGGSVGCFYFLASYGAPYRPGDLFRMASTSSLDFVAWGFAFRDVARLVVDIGRWMQWGNRAWAIERAWRRFSDWNQGGELPLDATLFDWQNDAARGERPGAVFNTTMVETGERMAIATITLVPSEEYGREFAQQYPHHTIRAATAVALSAAFPLVSPASAIWCHPDDARRAPIPPADRYHLVDGGYYDNYGVVSAIQFLETGFGELRASQQPLPEVLLVRIEGSESGDSAAEPQPGPVFQLSAPLKATLAMRSASQRARNGMELDLLQRRWPNVRTVRFPYPQRGAPLTWHLTDAQKREVEKAVDDPGIRLALKTVVDFLA